MPLAQARADSPNLFGWWTSANQSTVSDEPIPTLVPNQNYGYQDPANDIPAGGFEISNVGPDTAYAAITYATNGATVRSVVLQLAPNANDLPNSTVEACPLTSDKPFHPEQAGPSSDGPGYDCTTSVPGVAGSGGQSLSFAVGSLVKNGNLGIAIVAGAGSRTVFNPPDDSTVQVSEPDNSSLSLSDQGSLSSDQPATGSVSATGSAATAAPASTPSNSTNEAQPVASSPSAASPSSATPGQPPSSSAQSTGAVPQMASPTSPAQLVAVTTPTSTIGVGSATAGAGLVGLLAAVTIRRNRRVAGSAERASEPHLD